MFLCAISTGETREDTEIWLGFLIELSESFFEATLLYIFVWFLTFGIYCLYCSKTVLSPGVCWESVNVDPPNSILCVSSSAVWQVNCSGFLDKDESRTSIGCSYFSNLLFRLRLIFSWLVGVFALFVWNNCCLCFFEYGNFYTFSVVNTVLRVSSYIAFLSMKIS